MSYVIDFLKGGTLPHKHKNYEIIIFTKKQCTFHTEKKDFLMGPGKIAIIPPGAVHYSADPDFEQIYIRGEFNQFFFLSSPTIVLDNSEKEAVQLSKIIYANRYTDPEYVTALLNALVHFLLRNIIAENEISSTVRNIADIIVKNFYDCNIDLHSLLQNSGYSVDYIRAQFKKIMGKTPTEFLTKIRINHACYLMDVYGSTVPLADIAERSGYTDYCYFSRRFKQSMGISPKQYMKSD